MRRSHAKLLGLLWVLLAFLAGTAFFVGVPLLARSVPWSYEKKISSYVGSFPQFVRCDRPGPGQAAFKKIVSRIYPVLPEDRTFPVSVEVIDSDEVNAFASLGGKIYVFNGLLKQAQSAEEVAGVLAHEIEHVHQRHILQGVLIQLLINRNVANTLLNMRFSRDQEAEADLEGLRRLQAGKVDVSGFRLFFERAENQTKIPDLLSDHPSPENRVEMTRQFEGGAIVPVLTPEEWRSVKNLCGLHKHGK